MFGDFMRNKKIRFHCDNMAVVSVLNTMTSKHSSGDGHRAAPFGQYPCPGFRTTSRGEEEVNQTPCERQSSNFGRHPQ